jgi:dTMP kinase
MLIVFEGIDGSGKNTQIRKLLSFFRQHRVAYKLHKYPTKKAKEAFAHLHGKANVPAERLARLFAGDILAERKKIKTEIAGGFAVICDRYLQSTLAYQGMKAGYGKLKARLEGSGALTPDLVILLDIRPSASFERKSRQKKPDRFESDLGFLSSVRANYLRMADEGFLSYKYSVIDASKKHEEVFTEVITQVEPLVIKEMEK